VSNKPKTLLYGIWIFIGSFILCTVLLLGGVDLVKTPVAASDSSGDVVGPPGGPANITLVAKELKFDKGQLRVAPGASVTITVDNQDAGVTHNLAIYPSNRATAATDRIAGIDLFAGPAKVDLKFTAPKLGRYFFRCDVHPDIMTGQFIVQ
jgi:plastocyanin